MPAETTPDNHLLIRYEFIDFEKYFPYDTTHEQVDMGQDPLMERMVPG